MRLPFFQSRVAIACLLACAINALVPDAAAAAPDLTSLLAQDKPVKKVRVYLFPPNIRATLTAVREDGLVRSGCTYITENQDAIGQLIALLRNASLESVVLFQKWPHDLREAVYIDFVDGSSLHLLFSGSAGGSLVTANTGSGDADDDSFFKAGPVTDALWQWSTLAGENLNHSDMVGACPH